MGIRRFAVLLCAEDSEYVRDKYGGYFGVFKEMLAEPGEAWDVFRAVRGELPRDDAEIELYDGFVITGSCSDAHGDDPWIRELLEFLGKLDSMKKKVLGICFGHQLPTSVVALPQVTCNSDGVILACSASLFWDREPDQEHPGHNTVATFHCSFLAHLSMELAIIGSNGSLHIKDLTIPIPH